MKQEMPVVLLSLHKAWWELMKQGKKVLEIRKTVPKCGAPFRVVVCVTGGVGIVGEFVCDCFYKLDTMPEIAAWALPLQESGTPYNLEKASCLNRKQLKAYAGGSGKPLWGWHIAGLREYEKPLSLPEVGKKKAPQSWCYLGGTAYCWGNQTDYFKKIEETEGAEDGEN